MDRFGPSNVRRIAAAIDRNAAGHGWFVDPTPADDSEFELPTYSQRDSPATDRVDLPTSVIHEMGHLPGYEHADDGLMVVVLPLGML